MRTDAIVVDTHVLLWWLADDERLSAPAEEALRRAASVLVSPITFWEVAMLVNKGRVELDRTSMQWTNDVLAAGRVTDAPLTPEIAIAAAGLVGMHGDPADRFIAATAITAGVALVSKDQRLRGWAAESGEVVCIW